MDFEMEIVAQRDTTTIICRGELDMASAAELQEVLDHLVAPELVLDLREVTYIDSSGLRVLLLTHRTCDLTIRDPSAAVLAIMDLAGVREALHTDPAPDFAADRALNGSA